LSSSPQANKHEQAEEIRDVAEEDESLGVS